MGFASEMKQALSKTPTPTPVPTLPTQAAAPSEVPAEVAVDNVMNEGLPSAMPEHGSIHPEQAGLSPSEMNGSEVTPALAPAPTPTGKIRIGTEVFDTPEEAIQYATELQNTVLQRDAVEQYKTASAPKEPPPPEVDEYAELESKLFEDPRGTLQKVSELAEKKALATIEKQMAERQAAEQARQAEEQSWQSFFSTNSDLSQSKDLVEYVMTKHWAELSKLPPTQAPQMLAQKTRELLGSRRESMLPTKELQNRPAIVPGASSVAGQPMQEKKPTAVDFISQVRKHGKRT